MSAAKKKQLRTLQQNRTMWGLANELGIPHCDLQEIAYEISKGRTEHTSKLYVDEFNHLIKFLKDKLPKKPSRRTENYRNQQAGIKKVPSAKAKKFLRDLWLKYPHRKLPGLQLVCLNTIGKKSPTTAKECSDMIEAVKSMNARQERENELKKGRAA